MGFSLLSFFGKRSSNQGTGDAPSDTMTKPLNMSVPSSPFQTATGEGPFVNSMLFKTQIAPEPQTSPFNPFTSPVSEAANGLTVGDLLPGLPADITKNPGLSPQQSIVLPEAVLDHVLRGGHASIPIYELYKACPALFQMPVSPHDPREVPLSSNKISQLRAAKNSPSAQSATPANVSPFGFGAHLAASQHTPVGGPSSFGMTPVNPVAPASGETHFHPSPFSIAAPQSEASHAASPVSFPAAPSMIGSPASANPFFPAPAPAPAHASHQAPESKLASNAPSASIFGSPLSSGGGQPPAGFGFGANPGLFAPAPAVTALEPAPATHQSPFFTPEKSEMPDEAGRPDFVPQQSKMESFFGQNPTPDSLPKQEPAMFGMTAGPDMTNSTSAHHTVAESAAHLQPTAVSPMAAAPHGFNVTGETNPFFSAPVIEKDTSAPLPPVPAMEPDLGKPADNGIKFSTPAASPVTNPFARIQALAKSKEVAAASPPAFAVPAHQEPAVLSGGFLNADPIDTLGAPEPLFGSGKSSLFENLGLPTLEKQTPDPEFSDAIEKSSPSEPEIIKLGLASSLKNCAADELGTSPEHIPSWVQFSLQVDSIRSQLATGRVTVPFSSILEGLEPEVRGIFVKARINLMIELAANEVFHALTGNTTPDAEPVVAIDSPTVEVAEAPAMDPFASLTKTEWKEAPQDKDAESRFWSDLPTAAIPSTLFTIAKSEAPSIEETMAALPTEMPTENSLGEKQVYQEDVFIPANTVTGTPEFTSVAPLPPRSAPVQFTPARIDDQTRRLMLAVLLGSSDVPDVGAFASLTRRLPGVSAVLCIHQDRVVAADGDETCEAERFLREAPLKMRMLPSLTALTGIEDTETLHIQSGQGEATFCMQGEVTFAVLHDPRRREPVLKEKITLLGRELAAMLRDNPPA